jgi:hypothetical protein
MLHCINDPVCALLERGQRFDRQSMDVGFHQVVDRGVHQSMARNGGNSAKRLGHDSNAKVAVPIRSACMACMQMAFVFDG